MPSPGVGNEPAEKSQEAALLVGFHPCFLSIDMVVNSFGTRRMPYKCDTCCVEGYLSIAWKKFHVLSNRTGLALSETAIAVLCHAYADTSGDGKLRASSLSVWVDTFVQLQLVFAYGVFFFTF